MKPSRAMIPGEILCSAIGLIMAWFGGMHDGWLHAVLAARGEQWLWMALLGSSSLASMVLCLREYTRWKTWGWVRLEQTARWRGRAVLWQGLCWLHAVYFGYDYGAPLIGSIGSACFAFCVWAYLENRRTCREIRYATAAYI